MPNDNSSRTQPCGGYSDRRDIAENADISGHLEQLKENILIQTEIGDFRPLDFATQVVAGVNYDVTIARNDDSETFRVVYHHDLNGNVTLMDVIDN